MDNPKKIGLFFLFIFLFAVTIFLFKVISIKAGFIFLFMELVLFIVFTALHFSVFRHFEEREALLKSGISAEAVIIDSKDTGTLMNNDHVYDFTLDVSPRDGEVFRGKVRHLVEKKDSGRYKEGEKLNVKYDPKDKKVAII